MDANEANAADSAIKPAHGGQPVAAIIWRSKKPQKAPNSEMKALKLSETMKHLQPFFGSQPIELQSKSMLGIQEDIHMKTDGLTHHNDTTYQDNHNINAEGRPTEKPFIKSSLRIKPLLASYSTLKNNKRVADVLR